MVDSEGKELSFKIALGEKGEEIKNIHLPLTEGIAGWVARHGEALVVNDVSVDPRFSDRFDKQTGFRTRSILCVPILWEGKVLGVIEIINKIGGGEFSKSDEVCLAAFAQQASIAIHNARLIDELRNFFANAIEIFVEAIESIDPLSNGHLLRVARLSTAIGRKMNLGEEEYRNLYYASLIHDIGRLKGGEFAHHHPILGAEMVGPITLLKGTAEIIKCHHERSNGSGYPQGLKGEGIPLLARILSLAEAYDEGVIEKIGDKEFRERFTSDFLDSAEAYFGLNVANAFRQVVKEKILESIYG